MRNSYVVKITSWYIQEHILAKLGTEGCAVSQQVAKLHWSQKEVARKLRTTSFD